MTDMMHDATEAVPVEHDDHGHPSESSYWLIFLGLAVLTAVEVAWSYLGLSGPALVIPLLVMMVVKFAIVAGAFMHLYYDTKIINGKFFWWCFAAALGLAILVYLAVFASFEFEI